MTNEFSHWIYHVPTVDEVMAETEVGNGFHDWRVEGGVIRVTADELRPALEEAYDPFMPNWECLVVWDDETETFWSP
jgi:hypothetical protein